MCMHVVDAEGANGSDDIVHASQEVKDIHHGTFARGSSQDQCQRLSVHVQGNPATVQVGRSNDSSHGPKHTSHLRRKRAGEIVEHGELRELVREHTQAVKIVPVLCTQGDGPSVWIPLLVRFSLVSRAICVEEKIWRHSTLLSFKDISKKRAWDI